MVSFHVCHQAIQLLLQYLQYLLVQQVAELSHLATPMKLVTHYYACCLSKLNRHFEIPVAVQYRRPAYTFREAYLDVL